MIQIGSAKRAGMLIGLIVSSAAAGQGTGLITTDGMLGIKAGMTHGQVASLLNRQGSYDGTGAVDGGTYECNIYTTRSGLADVMIQRGIVTSVSTDNPRLSTASGAKVGVTDATLRRIYAGRLKRQENPYSGWDYYLYSRSGNGMRFHIDKGRVEAITAGRRGSVELAEGCV